MFSWLMRSLMPVTLAANQSRNTLASRISKLKASQPNPRLRAHSLIRPSRKTLSCMEGKSSIVTGVSVVDSSIEFGRDALTGGCLQDRISANAEISLSSDGASKSCAVFMSWLTCFMTWPFLVGFLLRDFHSRSQGRVARFPRHVGVTVRAGLCVSARYSIGQC